MKTDNQIEDGSPELIARNIQLVVAFAWGFILGSVGYWFASL